MAAGPIHPLYGRPPDSYWNNDPAKPWWKPKPVDKLPLKDRWYRVSEVAALMGVQKHAVYRWIKAGLPAVKLPGTTTRINGQVLADWVAGQSDVAPMPETVVAGRRR